MQGELPLQLAGQLLLKEPFLLSARQLLLPGVSAGTDEGSEIGNVTSERNGVTRYRFSHVIRDVTI